MLSLKENSLFHMVRMSNINVSISILLISFSVYLLDLLICFTLLSSPTMHIVGN
jgi:hypothetical protein